MQKTSSRNKAGSLAFLGLWMSLLSVVAMVPEGAWADVTAPAPGESPTVDKIRNQKVLRAGIAVTLPWIGQDPKTSKYFGPAIEQGEEIAKLLGVELELLPTTWDALIAQLQSDRVDFILATLTETEERRKVIDFVTWTEAGVCYAVLKDNAKVNTLDDLNQPAVSIGIFSGTGTGQQIRSKYDKAKIDSIPMGAANATRFEDVLAGRIDAAWLDSPLAQVVALQYPKMKIIPDGPNNCMKNPDLTSPMGMGISYGDPVWKKFLESVVAEMKAQTQSSLEKYSQPDFMLGQ